MAFHQNHLSQDDHLASLHTFTPDQQQQQQSQQQPNWLSTAISNNVNFLNLHTNTDSTSPQQQHHHSTQWLSGQHHHHHHHHHQQQQQHQLLQRNQSDVIDESMIESAELKNTAAAAAAGGENIGNKDESGGVVNWQNARCKAEILAHPLYEQLLSAHVACLRIATPVDQLPRIDTGFQ